MVFGREVDGRVLTFGVSGLLRQSNLIMWDHETESLWQQGTGEAIVGEMAGKRLELLPASQVAWKDFQEAFPEGKVLSRSSIPRYADLGFYGFNPYPRYDTSPFTRREVDPRLPAMERVVGIKGAEGARAYPFSLLKEVRVLYDSLDGQEFVILFRPDTRSPLDAERIAQGRPVGSAGVFRPVVEGKRLTFEAVEGGLFRDQETGSVWNVFGVALEGPLQGQRLTPVFHLSAFWFYWSTVSPETEVYRP